MKFVFLLFIICVTIFSCALGDRYTTKYDNIDYYEILQNERLLKNYMNCLMDRGRCTPEGSELKKDLPDALQTNCEKCSDAQKGAIKKVLKYIVENRRELFDELVTKYDPDGIYMSKYHDQLEAQGINL